MRRRKVTGKRRRPKRDAQKAQLREVIDTETDQEAADPSIALQKNAETQEEEEEEQEQESEAQEDKEIEEPIRAEELIRSQEDDALEQGDKEEESEKVEEEEREKEEYPAGEGDGDEDEGPLLLTDYEKQRKRRIEENAAKLAALNLPSLASSFGPSRQPPRKSSVRKSKKDADYMPSSSSDTEDSDSDDNNEENAGPLHQQDGNGEYDEDQALQQAIALSLTAPADKVTDTKGRVTQTRKGKRQASDKNDSAKKRKGRQQQFTSDEIAAIFAIIDERGNGKFSVAELERITRSHDFTWSNQEISDMIDIFDTNKDGQLDFSEFQGIFGRMNMLKMDAA